MTRAADVTLTMLCLDCGHWHDRTGRPLLGWQSNDGHDRCWPLPKGHRPPDYTIDGATGWEPIHGTCR